MYYPSGIIVDSTIWKDNDNNGFESDDLSSWEDEQRLVLKFELNHGETYPALEADQVVRCLACLNVDQDSEL